VNIGLVVEGQDDFRTYPILIRKIRNDIDHVHVRQCGGIRNLKNKFVHFLREFDSNPAYAIAKALVIRDSDCGDAGTLEQQLEQTLAQSGFAPGFPVHFHATKCKLESLLLADENAIVRVAQNRGKTPPGPLGNVICETLKDADAILAKRLTEANLPADAKVFSEIATELDQAVLAAKCPHFQRFAEKVRNG
jgi:hypothetical protein